MYLVLSIVLILIGAWLVWVPWREYRHAQATGAHRLPFSRMLLRMVVAGCVMGIGVMVYLGTRPRFSALAQLSMLLFAVVLALIMLAAGYTDYLLTKRDYLLGHREVLQDLVRRESPEEPAPPSSNGRDPSS
ncbi:MAG: hypothetical protein KY468_05890 [Armatimonadetes bacterium]|nr:hypothetical protein [Armatimonadota bacterium]